MITRRRLAGLIATSALAPASLARSALAQTSGQNWPSRHVRLIVPFVPGGAADLIARLVGSRLSEAWGQQIVVENRSGAGGNVGAAYVAKSAADGHTLLFATTSVVNNRFMYRNVPFDADRDFIPILLISKTPIVLVASPASGLQSLDTLIARAKANPGKINLGSPGHGTVAHIAAESLQKLAGFKLTHVPYRGSAPMIADLLGNQIDVVTADRFLAQIFAAVEKEHGEGNSEQRTQKCAQLPVRCPVASHIHLR